MTGRTLKILYIAGREESYSRTRNVLKGLRSQGIRVVGVFPPNRSFKHYPKLIWRAWRKSAGCDAVLVGFYGQIILPIIRILIRKPLLFDMYIATYDTMVNDRQAASPGSLKSKLFYLSDRLAGNLSDKIILETIDHIKDFAIKFGIDQQKFRRVFLAADSDIIFPRQQIKDTKAFWVHFHGEYAPFHGVKYIIKAAYLLRDHDIEFQIVGRGITYERDRSLAKKFNLPKVRFVDPVPYEELANLMAKADVCLGIFGENERMLRVTTNKVIEAIAMAKPLITGRNVPVQELLTHKQSVFLCQRANPQALADAILKLRDDDSLRNKIAQGGFKVFQANCTYKKLGQEFFTIIKEMLHHVPN